MFPGSRGFRGKVEAELPRLCTPYFMSDDVALAEKVGEMPRQFQPLGLTAGDAALSRCFA